MKPIRSSRGRAVGTEIIPDPEDIEAIEHEHGRLPSDASEKQRRRRYCLALMLKMIRLYDHGKLPLNLMREFENIRQGK
jgi:hypothetical protein